MNSETEHSVSESGNCADLAGPHAPGGVVPPRRIFRCRRAPMLELLDLGAKMDRDEARARVSDLGDALADLQRAVRNAGIPVVVLFEGLEAAGKGDSIAHLVHPLDPRGFKVRSTQSPTDED